MNEIVCVIKDKRTIDDKTFFIIQEKATKIEHLIPINQFENFRDIKPFDEYKFVKEINLNDNKTYLSIIHPNFEIGQELELKIVKILEIEGEKFYELESNYQKPLTVKVFDWQKNHEFVKCKVVGYKRGRPRLKNIETINNQWKIGEVKPFKILEFSKIINNSKNEINIVVIQIPDSTERSYVIAKNWQNPIDWHFKDIFCKIIDILNNGLPKLISFDSRHPHYELGKDYHFKVIDFTEKSSIKGLKYKVINVADEHDNSYEVIANLNLENTIKIGDIIECKVESINTRLQLKQVKRDPYFYDFDEIISDQILKNKYFLKLIEKNEEFNSKLKLQYEQKSGFWVFTYCNFILTRLKNEESERRNLTEVLKIIDIHTEFENWILKSGILRAIQDDEERKSTKLKTQQIIEDNTLEKNVISSIIDFKINELFLRIRNKVNFKEIYYFIKHSNIENIEEIELLKILISIKNINDDQKDIINKLIQHINKSLEVYKGSLKQDYFILTQRLKSNQQKEIVKYVNWIYIQILLSKLANLIEESNILISKYYRFNTLLIENKSSNEKLLLNAFFIISNSTNDHDIPVNLDNGKLEIQLDVLNDNPNELNFNSLTGIYKTKITKKHYKGFRATIDKINGFLPFNNIVDVKLRQNKLENIEWETNIEITLYCDKFKHFICKQLDENSENYYSKNLKIDKSVKKGDIIYGKVKNVTTFDNGNIGIFILTEYGDGLIYQSEITYNVNNHYDFKKIFKIGDKIPVFVIGLNLNNLTLGFKQLIGTKYEKEYYQTLNNFDFDIEETLSDEDINYDFRIELEKGFIFEQFAFFQDSIDSKIIYLKFAKAFFSNTKNARSYLLNIYIEYFNSIKNLDGLLYDYSIEKYNDFRSFIIKIKDKVQPLTLENFPESKNLLFFIDILHIFNSNDEKDLETVFNLVQKSIQENEILLKAVAKTVLSNNLILTEIDKNDKTSLNDYTLKNLKRIREYINQGILSVEESMEDKLDKELKEKRNYWLNKINEDEGEKLEFKATFITPIPTKEQNRIIDSLKKELLKAQSDGIINKINDRIKEIENLSKNVSGTEKLIMHSALKTICAFANTNGGFLLLGVSDDKRIFGLEQDYNTFKKENNRDGFGKFFDSMVKDYFGESFSSSLLEKDFLKFPEGDILIVKVNKSVEEVFILKNERGEKEEDIYVRNLSSSNKLKGIELSKFIRKKYRDLMNNNEIT
jgi:exosome complex RNA-binding protein Csl4